MPAAISETTATATSALTTGLQDVASQMINIVGTILPFALGVVGVVLAVQFGIKLFKKVSK